MVCARKQHGQSVLTSRDKQPRNERQNMICNKCGNNEGYLRNRFEHPLCDGCFDLSVQQPSYGMVASEVSKPSHGKAEGEPLDLSRAVQLPVSDSARHECMVMIYGQGLCKNPATHEVSSGANKYWMPVCEIHSKDYESANFQVRRLADATPRRVASGGRRTPPSAMPD